MVGYAVDGRPEPKIEEPKPATKSVNEVAAKFAERDKVYDDYEAEQEKQEGDEFAELADASVAAAKRIGRGVRRRAVQWASALKERIRHIDR